jgi:hypothetical protein
MNIINYLINNNIKDIIIKDGFYYIKNYTCMYGFSHKQYENNKDTLKDIDLINYIKDKQSINYYLVIDCRDDYSIEDLCHNINQLSIKPASVSILFYENEMTTVLKYLDKYLDRNIGWKSHNFLTRDITASSAIKSILDTNLKLLKPQYLWINQAKDLKTIIENKIVEKINFVTNVEQPVCNFIRSKNTDTSSVYDLFMNVQTYDYLSKKVDPMLDKSITIANTVSAYYD